MKTKYLFLLPVMVLAFSSCDLNEFPEDSLSPETYFQTESELQLFTNRFYLQEPTADELYDEVSDQYVKGSNLSNLILNQSRTVPASGGGWSFSMLRHINYYLANSYRVNNKTIQDQYDGVAYFWRAWFYFDKLRMFGEVPVYTEVLASDDEASLKKPRDSREVVIQRIIEDCNLAIERLPEKSDVFHVNKYTALGLKSRACLFEGTFRKYHAGDVFIPDALPYTELLQLAADAAKEVIDAEKYSLYTSGSTPYYSEFVLQDASQNPGMILARNYGAAPSPTHEVDYWALYEQTRPGFTKNLMFTYLMKDGTRFTDQSGWETMQFKEETANRDERFLQTTVAQNFVYADGNNGVFNITKTCTGYQLAKFTTGPSIGNTRTPSTQDMPVMRYAEILLNYAEAKAELGTITQEDCDLTINKLRARGGVAAMNLADVSTNPDLFLTRKPYGYENVDNSSKQGAILEVRRERGIELVCEGFRYYDLMRWREGQLLVGRYFGPYFPGAGRYDNDGDGANDLILYTTRRVTGGMKIGTEIILSDLDNNRGYIEAWPLESRPREFNEGRDYLYPIPTNERVLTNGQLTQNPGWDDGLSF